MNPRPILFRGVDRPNAPDAALRADLMREHESVAQGFREANRTFVPRLRPVTMRTPTLSASSWDLVLAVDGGTIYLPKLREEDEGDEVHVGIESGACTFVADDGAPIVGTALVTGPSRWKYTWAGAKWWGG